MGVVSATVGASVSVFSGLAVVAASASSVLRGFAVIIGGMGAGVA